MNRLKLISEYLAPEVEVFSLTSLGLLCVSDESINPRNPFTDDNENDWDD